MLADPPSMTAPSPDAPELAAHPPTPPPPPPLEETDAKRWNGRSPNPYIDKYITQAVRDYWATLKNQRQANKEKITALYGGGYTLIDIIDVGFDFDSDRFPRGSQPHAAQPHTPCACSS